ncbi:MAG: TraM recognition domain-containing protein [Psychrosphaera sp.]|nr:TraM recognition domain-containing protein [Psychrosphaera sp.]
MHSSSQISDLITAMRQYGMALTVAMQNSAQLKAQDPSGYVFSSVVESCKTKIIFNCAGEDAKYFAENIFKDKGKMEEVSYSFSNGEAKAFTISNTTGYSQGYNESKSETDTTGESTAKALGHSVSEGFNRSTNTSHTDSTGSSEGKTNGSSTGKGESYKDGMRYQDITRKSSSMISSSQQFTKNKGSSDTKGSSEGTSNTTTNSETNTTTNSKSHSDGQSYGISESTSETMGLAKQLSQNSSCSKSIRRVTIAEETRLYAQQLTSLEQREAFIASGNNLKKAVSLDSLFVKMENQLEPYLDNYFEYLYSYQDIDRWAFKGKVTVKKSTENTKPISSESVGVETVF